MEIPDAELRDRLITHGFNPPPITSTSREILRKKLIALETGCSLESMNTGKGDEEPDDSQSGAEQSADGLRQRVSKPKFSPVDIGVYSRCYVKKTDFWDRIGIFGTVLVLLIATIIVFFVFKFIGDWSDRRYRAVHLSDVGLPKCSEGGVLGNTCVPDSELKFTETNLNILRAALHHATLTDRCSSISWKSSNFIGMYPIFKDDYVKNLLVKELAFKQTESEMLLRNAKVVFKLNPRLDVKVLEDGLMYRNQRLLRSCGYMSWNSLAYSYALYFLASVAAVGFTYKLNRFVSKLRSGNGEERRRLIKDIYEILKQSEKETGNNFVTVKEVREWLLSEINLSTKLWNDVINHLREYEESISLKSRVVQGEECNVFCLKK